LFIVRCSFLIALGAPAGNDKRTTNNEQWKIETADPPLNQPAACQKKAVNGDFAKARGSARGEFLDTA
jgi:hypothetical protein